MGAGPGGQYRINLVWTSHGGQVLATMGQIQSGMRTVGGTALREQRNVGVFNRQMQALGTTLRYFFAGSLIFGGAGAFRGFAQFQSALGDIAAISENLTSSDISRLGDQLLGISTGIAAPVGELEDSARNIQSTMQLTREEAQRFLPEFVEMFGKGAKVAESDAYNFGQAIMGMRNAFDLGLTDMQRISGEFFTTIERSAGMTGDEWAKFSGRVVAGAGIAGASLEEMNALMILMTRQGGTAATNVRHLAQFLQRLRDPTQETLPAWERIGLGKEELATLPFEEIIKRLREAVRQAGGISRGRALNDESIAALEEAGQLTPEALGMKGGGAQVLTELFGRMESRRAALVVLSEMLSPKKEGLQTYEELLTDLRDTQMQIEANDSAFDRWLDRNRIQQAGNALRNMLTESLLPAEDIINRISRRITGFAESPHGPRAVQAAAGAAAAYGLYRVGRGGIGGAQVLMGRLRGLGGAGMAAGSLAGLEARGSFTHPFWVMIHPASNIPGLGGAGRGGIPPVIGAPGGYTRYRQPSRFGRFARGAGRATIVGGILMAANETFDSENRLSARDWLLNQGFYGRRSDSERTAAVAARMRAFGRRQGRSGLSATDLRLAEMKMSNPEFDLFGGLAPMSQDRAARIMGYVNSRKGGGLFGGIFDKMRISGQTAPQTEEVRVTFDATDEAKKLLRVISVDSGTSRKRTHVPVGHNAWKGSAIPQFRGGFRMNRNQ